MMKPGATGVAAGLSKFILHSLRQGVIYSKHLLSVVISRSSESQNPCLATHTWRPGL